MKVRAIAAIDNNQGFANENGIPWELPTEHKYYTDTVYGNLVLMGYGTYLNHPHKIHEYEEYVLTSNPKPLRDGFVAVNSLVEFINSKKQDIWILGGEKVFEEALPYLDELYLTQIHGDFKCTKFFPPFKHLFKLAHEADTLSENGIDFNYQIWVYSPDIEA